MKKAASSCLAIIVLLGLLGVACWIALFIFGIVHAIVEGGKDYPGKAQFEAANRQLNVYEKTSVLGDSPDAIQLADKFSSSLQELANVSFTGGSKLNAATGGHYLTYCSITPKRVVILCHVPDLRGYKDDVRELLARLAWLTAQEQAKALKIDPNTPLVVGLRGFASYGPIWEGKVTGDPQTKSDGLMEMKEIYPYFAPPSHP